MDINSKALVSESPSLNEAEERDLLSMGNSERPVTGSSTSEPDRPASEGHTENADYDQELSKPKR